MSISELVARGDLLAEVGRAACNGVPVRGLGDVVDELRGITAELRDILGPPCYHALTPEPRGQQVAQFHRGGQ